MSTLRRTKEIEDKLEWMNVDEWDRYVWLADYVIKLEDALNSADGAVEAWRDKCQCDCPAEVFLAMEELSTAIYAAKLD